MSPHFQRAHRSVLRLGSSAHRTAPKTHIISDAIFRGLRRDFVACTRRFVHFVLAILFGGLPSNDDVLRLVRLIGMRILDRALNHIDFPLLERLRRIGYRSR